VRPFARYYDAIYSDKDYDRDIEVLALLSNGTDLGSSKILEIGAGTGSHTVRLAGLCSQVTALEIDTEFAELARQKTTEHPTVQLLTTPVERLQETSFDGAVAFFNVLNYITPPNMSTFLAGISTRLKTGGFFITDLWNAEAVLADPPRPEVRKKQVGSTAVTQSIAPHLDPGKKTVQLDYDVTISIGARQETFSEAIQMHLWDLRELTAMLREAGLTEVTFWDRRQPSRQATSSSWHVWMHTTKH
jgi:SAM-dependent methyltransferase